MTIENQWDKMKRCAIELVDAIKKLAAEEEVRPRRQIEALQKLSDKFKLNIGEDNARDEIRTATSATPTAKAAIRETPRVHGRLTRNNTPGILPTFEGGKQQELLATSEGEKQRKKVKLRNEPTQTNYYDGPEETTDGDEEMEQEPKGATWSKANGIMGICAAETREIMRERKGTGRRQQSENNDAASSWQRNKDSNNQS